MKPSALLSQHRDLIRDVVARYAVENPRIYGSVLHEDDTEESDLDLLVDPTEQTTLFTLAALEEQLSVLLGCDVDVVTPAELKQSYREDVLAEAVPL